MPKVYSALFKLLVIDTSLKSSNKTERFIYQNCQRIAKMGEKQRKQIKCEGRFHELRENIAEALELLVEEDPDYRLIHPDDLNKILDIIEGDTPKLDAQDRYYDNKRDNLRTDPSFIGKDSPGYKGLALVPLVTPDSDATRGLIVSNALHLLYAQQFSPNPKVVHDSLYFAGDRDYTTEGVERLDLELGIRMSNIIIPVNGNGNGNGTSKNGNKKAIKNLSGYKLAAGFAIGPNAKNTLVYDAPYHIELHVLDPKAHQRAERTAYSGVMGIGFWLNKDNEMLVAQIQQMRGAKLPEGVCIGAAGLSIAEAVARAMGFSRVTTYSAKTHPQFAMHPDSESQLMGAFRLDYDRSAQKLGFEPIIRKDSTNNDVHVGYTKRLQ